MRQFEIVSFYLNQGIKLPKRATRASAGYDLACAEDLTIPAGEIRLVPTGLKVVMPPSEALFVFPRSSIGIKKGLIMSNGVGIVDADYHGNPDNEGHIMVPLYNLTKEAVTLTKGERIAQGVFMRYEKTSDDETDDITRLGGFGSSGA
ncbi:MAG: dUTP diphosphatase [Acholeplasmataceae bacterium]|nr:MAG: dUTP diphosphatase [Acholeplasmataceae bacterium]